LGICFTQFSTLGRNDTELVYADPLTWSGPDEDASFDTDDEFVFMARHLGQRYDGADIASDLPDGVDAVRETMICCCCCCC
jgi:hypothetical protein